MFSHHRRKYYITNIVKCRNYCSGSLTVSPSLYFDSNTDIAARDPEPIVAKGRVSVEPCG
jgi:hypothetical protein